MAGRIPSPLCAMSEADVVAFHPGPGRDFAIPNPPLASPEERLAAKEGEMLETSIERFAGRDGRMADLARSIIVLRAEVRMRATPTEGTHHE